MFTRTAILQLGIALLIGCEPKDAEDCGDGEFKTIEGDCVADTADDGGGGGGGGPIDDPPEPVEETGGREETDEPEETGDPEDSGDPEGTGDSEDSGDPEETGDPEGTTDLSVAVRHDPGGVGVTVSSDLSAFEFGMVETDYASPDPWTGEDCLFGYTTGAGYTYELCHAFDGATLELAPADSLDDLVEGETTLFHHLAPAVTTYVLFSMETGECWVWGHDVSYYSGMGCVEL